MMKKSVFLIGPLLFLSSTAFSMAVDWSGSYRFEYMETDKVYLKPGIGRKSYLLNHLSLSPKIIAADGINIISNFEVLGNASYPDSQVGQQFGANSSKRNAAASQNQSATNLTVRELYLKIDQEYGEIVAGRAPLQFGLGMTYNAGKGAFDHWGDIEDMVGYKFLVGNLSFMPMIGKPYDMNPAQGADITDSMINIEYNNPETESIFGVFYRTRNASQASNFSNLVYDKYVNSKYDLATVSKGWSTNHTNVMLARGWESFKFRLEAGFDSGSTGLTTSVAQGSEDVNLNGYGVALELEFPRPGKFQWMVRAGMASGDNPTTANFEGYHFDRNYDLGFLLFNHPMGSYDALSSNAQRNLRDSTCTAADCPRIPNEEALDEETVSNAIYLSPKFSYAMSDKWEWRNILTYAQLQTVASTQSGVSKDLGWEWDTALVFRPHERVQWVNELGFFFPGGAWKEGSAGHDAGFNYGFQSKAAISF